MVKLGTALFVTSLTFALIFLVGASSQAFALHDSSVSLQPELSIPDSDINYTVTFCKLSGDPIEDVRIYKNYDGSAQYVDFTCNQKYGWDLWYLVSNPACIYAANTTSSNDTIKEDNECRNFTFSAHSPALESHTITWQFSTRDINNGWNILYDTTTIGTQQMIEPSDLVAEYHFDGNASDSSVNGNDGAIYGATFVPGISGQALSFELGDHVIAKDNGLPSGVSPKTLSAWIKTDGMFASYGNWYGTIFVYGAASYGEMFYVGIHNQGNVVVSQYGESYIADGADVFDNKWHNVVVTYDGVTYRTYVDGLLTGSRAMSTDTNLIQFINLMMN